MRSTFLQLSNPVSKQNADHFKHPYFCSTVFFTTSFTLSLIQEVMLLEAEGLWWSECSSHFCRNFI